MDVRDLSSADPSVVPSLEHLFDGPADAEASARFARDPLHHLVVAFVDDVPVGFVSGVELTHPDKGTEMFLYELAVDDGYRRQGIGTALVRALETKARALGCYGMWVLTEYENDAAVRTYRAAGSGGESMHVMFDWHFDETEG